MKRDNNKKTNFIEKFGKKIPDPVIIFAVFFAFVMILSVFMGGVSFDTVNPDGSTTTYKIQNMFKAENFRWIFDNAILTNWLAYGHGVLGTILVVMFGVGLAEESGLLTTLIKKVGTRVSDKMLPVVIVFIGIMSSIATDAGYLILIPLAGLLYAGLKKNPLIGMAAAFAGVSAGFSANLIPGTPIDVIVGKNAQLFAEGQGVPFISSTGQAINASTMHYIFIVASTILLSVVGYFVTTKIIQPKLEKEEYVIPKDMNLNDFTVKKEENKALLWSLLGLILAIIIIVILAYGPLKPYTQIAEDGTKTVVKPIMDNIILIITFAFFIPGLFYGVAVKKFKNAMDVVKALSKQMSNMGYVLVLTFICYNFLALLTYSNLGNYITYLGAKALENLGLSNYPILLLIGFIIVTAIINLFVGGLTSKWMLLGPIFIPMLYKVNSTLTPDMVSAAYRIADSSTNVISPLMSYAGIILVFMKKYKPEYTLGDMIKLMAPYSISFLITWTILLITFLKFGIPLGI